MNSEILLFKQENAKSGVDITVRLLGRNRIVTNIKHDKGEIQTVNILDTNSLDYREPFMEECSNINAQLTNKFKGKVTEIVPNDFLNSVITALLKQLQSGE